MEKELTVSVRAVCLCIHWVGLGAGGGGFVCGDEVVGWLVVGGLEAGRGGGCRPWWAGHPARMCGYKYDGVNPKWGLDSGESDGKNPLDDIEEVLWDLARMLNGNGKCTC